MASFESRLTRLTEGMFGKLLTIDNNIASISPADPEKTQEIIDNTGLTATNTGDTNDRLDNLNETANNISEGLDSLGTDLELIVDSNSEIASDIALIGLTLDTINSNVSGLSTETTQVQVKESVDILKKEEMEYVRYRLDVLGEVLVSASANPYIRDPIVGRDGWYYENAIQGGSTLFWFSSEPQAPGTTTNYRANSVLSLSSLTVSGGFYAVMWLDKVVEQQALPIFAIYTVPTGSGDAAPGFYKTRVTYRPALTERLYAGEMIVLYNNVSVLDKIKNVYPNARRVALAVSNINGTNSPSEIVRFLSINGDSGTDPFTQAWVVNSAGFYDGEDTVNNYEFVVADDEPEFAQQDTLVETNNTLLVLNDNANNISQNTIAIFNEIIQTNNKIEDVKLILNSQKNTETTLHIHADSNGLIVRTGQLFISSIIFTSLQNSDDVTLFVYDSVLPNPMELPIIVLYARREQKSIDFSFPVSIGDGVVIKAVRQMNSTIDTNSNLAPSPNSVATTITTFPAPVPENGGENGGEPEPEPENGGFPEPPPPN